jgi:hypothetical protein
MRYESLIARVHELSGLPRSGEFENLVEMALNARYFELLSLTKGSMEEREFSLTTVADQAKYGMPVACRKVLEIEDTTNRKILYSLTTKRFVASYPGATETGTPELARPYGSYGVQAQPASAGIIKVVSDSTLDDGTGFTISVVGTDASGNPIREELEANGTTSVSSTLSFTTVDRVVKSPVSGTNFEGNITVKDVSNNTLSVIPVWWESVDYEWVEFQPTPSSAITYTIHGEARKPPLVNAEDWPEIDLEFHDLLWRGAFADLAPKIGLLSSQQAMQSTLNDRMDEYLSQHGLTGNNRSLVFANVWNQSTGANVRRRLRHSTWVSSS